MEYATLSNLSNDYFSIKELNDSLNQNGIFGIEINNSFKGGTITQKVFSETDCDAIQIEINAKFINIK